MGADSPDTALSVSAPPMRRRMSPDDVRTDLDAWYAKQGVDELPAVDLVPSTKDVVADGEAVTSDQASTMSDASTQDACTQTSAESYATARPFVTVHADGLVADADAQKIERAKAVLLDRLTRQQGDRLEGRWLG